MNAIYVEKSALLDKLKANRDQHRSIFLEAQAGYRTAVIKELDSMLAEARAGKKIRRSVTLVEPVDQTRDYDRTIAMLEMSVDDKIKLEEHDFRAFVMDEWGWRASFNTSKCLVFADPLGDAVEHRGIIGCAIANLVLQKRMRKLQKEEYDTA